MPKAFLSFTVVVKKLNELYKSSVSSCHCLNVRLQRFFLDKQKLMDRINSITAEKLIFSYAVQMVKTSPCLGLGLAQRSAGHSWFLLLALAGGSPHDTPLWRLGKESIHAAEGLCWESWVCSGSKLLVLGCCPQVQSAALDEMFHHREDCAQRYHKALLLMEGLLNIITEQGDIENISKCEY